MYIPQQLSEEFTLNTNQTGNVLSLFKDKATIPFIARYRKEATEGLDEVILRKIKDRYEYLMELLDRKTTILKSIDDQGNLTTDLKSEIDDCIEKSKLEDLYLPFKPKRKTRASAAREKGLEPLLNWLLTQRLNNSTDIYSEASKYINIEKGVEDTEAALKGASDIYAEMISEKAYIRDLIRTEYLEKGSFVSKVRTAYKDKKSKFEMYYNFQASVKTIKPHNMLALRRAEKEEVILFDIEADTEKIIDEICNRELLQKNNPASKFFKNAIIDSYKRLIKNSICAEVRLGKKLEADLSSIEIFEKNLQNLLLAPPTGRVKILAVDPGFRSGCKIVALDDRGMFKEFITIYPYSSQQRKDEAKKVILKLIGDHTPNYIAIGNGTASRETEHFIKDTLQGIDKDKKPVTLLVSESGASVYSASESAIKEFPEHDITVRGAISIGRRLMDPLAELVKIDPKSIGVGQYQHDVDQKLLKKKLEEVVESCVNHIGVDLNTASVELLSYVSGIKSRIAENIVKHREEIGSFANRKSLLNVSGLGEKVFEQAAGFLRIKDGDNPLDNSAVHPESYYIVKKILKKTNLSITEAIGNADFFNKIDPSAFTDDNCGVVSIKEILEELKKGSRDPRSTFKYADFDDKVQSIEDVNEGMKLDGIVTNVAHFGAFVDIGVHQDGLVHVSQLSNKFVKNPTDVIKVGQSVTVKVLKIDRDLKRISLSMK